MNLHYRDIIENYLFPKISDLLPKDAIEIGCYPHESDNVELRYKVRLPFSSKPLEVKYCLVKISFTGDLISEYIDPETRGIDVNEDRMIYDIRKYIHTELEQLQNENRHKPKENAEIKVNCKNLGFPL